MRRRNILLEEQKPVDEGRLDFFVQLALSILAFFPILLCVTMCS